MEELGILDGGASKRMMAATYDAGAQCTRRHE